MRVQITLKAVGFNPEEAARILRLCYMQAESGASKEAVELYKKTLVAPCRVQGAGDTLSSEAGDTLLSSTNKDAGDAVSSPGRSAKAAHMRKA